MIFLIISSILYWPLQANAQSACTKCDDIKVELSQNSEALKDLNTKLSDATTNIQVAQIVLASHGNVDKQIKETANILTEFGFSQGELEKTSITKPDNSKKQAEADLRNLIELYNNLNNQRSQVIEKIDSLKQQLQQCLQNKDKTEEDCKKITEALGKLFGQVS